MSSSDIFTNLEFLFVIGFFQEIFSIKITVILAFWHLFGFLYENPFRRDQSKRQISWKNSVLADSEFVKTCDELVIE